MNNRENLRIDVENYFQIYIFYVFSYVIKRTLVEDWKNSK